MYRRPISQAMTPRPLGLICVAVLLSVLLAALGLGDYMFTDYDTEARPAFTALVSGDLRGFFDALPPYAGAMFLRAPFALGADALGGGELAVYRAVAVPGIAALATLAVVLAQRVPGRGAWVVLVLATANPLALEALEYGHAEELLVGTMCVGAILLALADRPLLAGAVVGLAVVGKPWAVLAVAPVVLALPRGGAVRALAAAGAVAVTVALPVLLFGGTGSRVGAETGHVFHPWQLWWFLGSGDDPSNGVPGYRDAPSWLSPLTHPLIVVVGAGMAAAWARRGRDRRDALALLALILLMRCILDPWNNPYYELPVVLALLSWEAVRGSTVPAFAAAVTACAWLTLVIAPAHVPPDVYSILFLSWALPCAILLGLRVYAPPRAHAVANLVRRHLPSGDVNVSVRPSAPSAGR